MTRLAVVALLAACAPHAPHAPPPVRQLDTAQLAGDWRWILRTEEAGTSRVETEDWHLAPSPSSALQLVGRYVRTVEVRSLDRVPFRCNERPWYRQRAVYDVTVQPTATGFAVRETDYLAEASPCDHGFRRLGGYAGDADGERFTLRWDGGSQTLWQTDTDVAELPVAPWPPTPELTGPWRWDATSYDDYGNLRDESEWWEITRRTEARLDLTYRRRVTIRSPDGSIIACAGGPTWSFDDAYVLDGEREEEHWHLRELAADPGEHPCLQATPRRSLDEATAEQIGDFLVLEWRGKRREILYRAE